MYFGWTLATGARPHDGLDRPHRVQHQVRSAGASFRIHQARSYHACVYHIMPLVTMPLFPFDLRACLPCALVPCADSRPYDRIVE